MSVTFSGVVIMESVSRWGLTTTFASVRRAMSLTRELELACLNTPNVSHVDGKNGCERIF